MVEDRNVWLWRDFRDGFLGRFRAATVCGLAMASLMALAGGATFAYAGAARDSLAFAPPLAVAAAVLAMIPVYAAHLFVLLAQGHPVAGALKAAAIGVLARPLPGLAGLGFVAALWLAHVALYPASVLVPVLFGFSLGALAMTFAVHRGARIGLEHVAAATGRFATRPQSAA
jgi:hypothetical protein